MTGSDGSAGLVRVDPHAVVVYLKNEPVAVRPDDDVDRRWVGVLDGVDDELLGHGEQEAVRERAVIDVGVDRKPHSHAPPGTARSRHVATLRSPTRAPSRDGRQRSTNVSLRSPCRACW